jgi:hypothetical protein
MDEPMTFKKIAEVPEFLNMKLDVAKVEIVEFPDEIRMTIPNPNKNEPILIHMDTQEIIIVYSTQHRHYDYPDLDDLLEYIRRILHDDILTFEYYSGDSRIGGGDMGASEVDWSRIDPVTSISKLSMKDRKSLRVGTFVHRNCMLRISCWSGSSDRSIEILWE